MRNDSILGNTYAMNTVFHGSAGPLNVPGCCCHRRHVTSRYQSHVVGQCLRDPIYQVFHKDTFGRTPVGNIPVHSDEILRVSAHKNRCC